MTAIRLTICTDDEWKAAQAVLCCRPTRLPAWAQLLTDPHAIALIPDGRRCIGLWYPPGNRKSLAELAWLDRRQRGGIIVGLTAEEIDRLSEIAAARGEERQTMTVEPVIAAAVETEAATPERPVQRWM